MNNISLRDYIENGVYDEQLENAFREFMQSKCRRGMTPYRRFNYFEFVSLESIGLYTRLVYDYDKKDVSYIAGQDYSAEIARLKKFMLK